VRNIDVAALDIQRIKLRVGAERHDHQVILVPNLNPQPVGRILAATLLCVICDIDEEPPRQKLDF
jgi:hypothetical protein